MTNFLHVLKDSGEEYVI